MTPEPGPGLAARLRRGDVAAITALLEHEAPRAYRVAVGLTRSAAEAEAVVREVFAALGADLERATSGAGLRPWVYRTTVRVALARGTAARAGGGAPSALDLPAFAADGSRLGAPGLLRADWSRLGPEALEMPGARIALQEAVERLPERERITILLCDVEGLSVVETAEVLDEPVGATRARLHRGRMALREVLTGVLGASPPGRDPVRRP